MSKSRARRDTAAIASHRLSRPVDALADLVSWRPGALTDFEDGRQWLPGGSEAPRRVFGGPARVDVPPNVNRGSKGRFRPSVVPSVPYDLGFSEPKEVVVCARRQARREVLLAKGRGGGKHRPPRLSEFSKVRCK